jgi:hypothetical protein
MLETMAKWIYNCGTLTGWMHAFDLAGRCMEGHEELATVAAQEIKRFQIAMTMEASFEPQCG